jgi:tight adherence protein C
MAVAVLLAALVATGMLMIFVALAQMSAGGVRMQERLRRAALRVSVDAIPEENPLDRPLAERILLPLDEFLSRRAPAERLRRIQERLNLAGRPMDLTVGRLLALKLLIGLTVTVLVGLFLLATNTDPFGLGLVATVGLSLAFGAGAYFLPDLYIRQMLQARKEAIRRQLPEVCDLLSVCVDAGASFDVALARVVASPYLAGPLVTELRGVLRQMEYASGRLDALNRMADRLQVEDVRIFVIGLGESFKRGAPIADELRIQSDDIRRRHREHAEEQAAQAAVKLLIPLIFLIFPTLFLVMLTPALIQAVSAFQGAP